MFFGEVFKFIKCHACPWEVSEISEDKFWTEFYNSYFQIGDSCSIQGLEADQRILPPFIPNGEYRMDVIGHSIKNVTFKIERIYVIITDKNIHNN
jgi:hypothetical protein